MMLAESSFLSNAAFANEDVLLNSVNTITGNEDAIVISGKSVQSDSLTLTQSAAMTMMVIFVIAIPSADPGDLPRGIYQEEALMSKQVRTLIIAGIGIVVLGALAGCPAPAAEYHRRQRLFLSRIQRSQHFAAGQEQGQRGRNR